MMQYKPDSRLGKIRQLLWGDTARQEITANIYWLLLEKLVRYLLGFVVSVWVVRYMGPGDYGAFNYAIAFTGIAGVLIGLGIEQILVRELVKFPERRDELLSNSFLLFAFSSIAALIIGICSIYLLRGEDQEAFWLVSILSVGFLFKPFSVIGLYLDSKVMGHIAVPFTIATLLVTSALKIYAIAAEASLYIFASIVVLEEVLYALSLIYLYYSLKLKISIRRLFNPKLLKDMLRHSFPLLLSSFMILIYMKIDQIMLREMVSDEEVGVYSVAMLLTSIWFFIPMIIARSFFPKIVGSMQTDQKVFEQQLQKLYNLIALVGYVLCIPFSILSNHIVSILYGEAFLAAGPMLSLLIWTAFFMGFGVVRTSYVFAMNLGKAHLMITIIGAVGNIGLNLILIPLYQGFGAVLATLISQIFTCFVSSFIFRSLRSNGMMMIKAALYPKIL
jgi:O-antigen/teichoic acid export membrane protein